MLYLRNDPRNYSTPTNKSLESARSLKSRQQTTPEQYEEDTGHPAPAWMRASAEQVAKHIDLVYYFATIHGVQLKWEQVEYGLSDEEIEAVAIAKKSCKYGIGDIMPREAETVAEGGRLTVRNYHGTYYITYDHNDAVVGIYLGDYGEYRATANNLTRENIIAVRFDSAQAACDIACLDKVVSEWVKNNRFVDVNDAPLRAAWSSEYGSLSLSLESEEIAAAENFDLFTFMDAVKYRHLNAKLVNGNIKIGDKLFSPEKSNHPIVL